MTTGKTVQALNTLKNLLHRRLAESEWLSKEVGVGVGNRPRLQAAAQWFGIYRQFMSNTKQSLTMKYLHLEYANNTFTVGSCSAQLLWH